MWKHGGFSSYPQTWITWKQSNSFFSFFGSLQAFSHKSSIGQAEEVAVSNVQLALYFTICLSVHNQHTYFWALHPKRSLIPGNVVGSRKQNKKILIGENHEKEWKTDGSDQQSLGLQPDCNYLPKSSLMLQHQSPSQLCTATPLFTDIPNNSPPRQRGASWGTRSCIFCTFLQAKNVKNFYIVLKTMHFIRYAFICTHMFRC